MLLKKDEELYAIIRKLHVNDIVCVINEMGDYYTHYYKSRIFVRIVSYTLPKFGLFKHTPGEVVAELPNGTRCNLLDMKYSGDYIFVSLSNGIRNIMDDDAKKTDEASHREQLPSYRYLIRTYNDNIELKKDMEEYNRSKANLLELKAQLEKEAMEREAEEKRKQDEYNAQNASAAQAVNDMFGRM